MYLEFCDNLMKSLSYPDNWRMLAMEIKAANGYKCQACGQQCRRPGEMWLGWEYELTVAHVDQDYEGETIQLAPLCVRCHLRLDAPFAWLARRRHHRTRQRLAGQLDLQLPSTASIHV
jgi:hypothetical protein